MSISSPPTGDRRHARREATRRAILDAAESIVIEDGYEALKSKTLAERAGISERSLFNHFANLPEIVLARVSSYLVRIMDEPGIPPGLPVGELPEALDRKFRDSFARPEADELFGGFLELSVRLHPDMMDMLARHIVLTLAEVAERLTNSLKEDYPLTDFEQSVKIQLYIFNLTSSIAFGLLHGIHRLGLSDAAQCTPPSGEGAGTPHTIPTLETPELPTLNVLREDLNWAFAQVANGRPRI